MLSTAMWKKKIEIRSYRVLFALLRLINFVCMPTKMNNANIFVHCDLTVAPMNDEFLYNDFVCE